MKQYILTCRHSRLLCFLPLTLFVSITALAQESAPLEASPGPLTHALQPFVDKQIIGGMVALVADKDKVLALEAMGSQSLAKKTPMQTNDLFWIASMSKSVTATGLYDARGRRQGQTG